MLGMYVPVLDLRMVTIIENADHEIVGVGISMASLSRALQKAKGKLWPFGWFHLLKALRSKPEIVDLYLMGVLPEYQSKGVNAPFLCSQQPWRPPNASGVGKGLPWRNGALYP